jgi:hypothetical protein
MHSEKREDRLLFTFQLRSLGSWPPPALFGQEPGNSSHVACYRRNEAIANSRFHA